MNRATTAAAHVASRSDDGRLRPDTQKVRPASRSARLAPYLFIAPAVGYLIMLTLLPLIQGVRLSFTDTALINPDGGNYVGVGNYADLLADDRFWNSVWATFVYTGVTVVASTTLGTIAAIVINQNFKGRATVRVILTFPWAVPTVAAALIFIWIYNQENGVLNAATTGILGIGEQGWLTDPDLGMFSVLLATVWKVFPLVMLVVLAALQGVSDDLVEASKIDGADHLNIFRNVVLPHILPTIRVVTLLMTIWSIRRFEIIYLLTGGGPSNRTNTLVVNVYREAFLEQNLGVAAAIAGFGLVLSLLITAAFLQVERRESRRERA